MQVLDIDRVRAALANSPVGHRIHYRQSVGSTMDVARDMAKRGEAEGAVVIAEEQNRGRGRFDRRWVSPPLQNLYLTALLRPKQGQLPFVNMAAALAVHQTVEEATGARATVKWPNDVRVGGKKLAGILVETEFEGAELDHALVGIGLNVNLDVSAHPEIAETAASLRSVAGREFEREAALETMLSNLGAWYARVKRGEALTSEWTATLDTLGRHIQLRWKERTFEGLAESVDDQGSLVLLRADGGRVTVTAGEVTSQV